MKVLGISAYYHDSAAALVADGRIVAAAHEERFTRRKHDAGFPARAIEYCLREAELPLRELDAVVYYEKPFIKFERLLETYLAFAPRGFRSFSTAMPAWIKDKLFLRGSLERSLRAIDDSFRPERLKFSDHHYSHAASAFFAGPFEKAIVVTCDGVGEWATTTVGIGDGSAIRIDKQIDFPHSLGLLYSAFTYYCGFKVNSGEYKLMGLAPYGEPRYVSEIYDKLIEVKADGSFRLDLSYFDYCTGLTMTSPRFDALWGGRGPRDPASLLTQLDLDLAASIQVVIEESLIRIVRAAVAEYGRLPLVLAGGVALNCVANGRLLTEGVVDRIWVQPAAGDAGGALGAALAYSYANGSRLAKDPGRDAMQGACLGPRYSGASVEGTLREMGVSFVPLGDDAAVVAGAAGDLAAGMAVGWHQGRSEYGPRALGARSILADPRLPSMQSALNLKIKFRESFRPFAPSVLAEDCAEWFDLTHESPYMLLVASVARSRLLPVDGPSKGLMAQRVVRSVIPAVTHVDNSARVQTVDAATSPMYHALLTRFKELTGCSVLVNTSFNVRGEPMVETPRDAVRCFLGTGIDRLYVGRFLLRKEDQPGHLMRDYSGSVEPD